MKATLWFTALSMVFAMPVVSAKTELETLRERCSAQEKKIRQLEQELQQVHGDTKKTTAPETTGTVAAPVEKSSDPASTTYVVKAGDNVEKIAREHGCSVANLTKINGMTPSTIIRPGQRLKLPGDASEKSETPTKKQPDESTQNVASTSEKSHRIEQGETYSSISRKYGIPVKNLMAANPGIKATALRPGLMIQLPAAASAAKKPDATNALATYPVDRKANSFEPVVEPTPKPKTAETARSTNPPIRPVQLGSSTTTPILAAKSTTPTPAPPKTAETAAAPAKAKSGEEPKPSANPNTERKIRSIKIESQMTYGQFAANHGTDVKRLNDLNGLDLTTATVLAKGSELYVPAQP